MFVELTVTVSSTKNYSDLSTGTYTCATFPYASYPHSTTEGVDDATNTFLDVMILVGGFLGIFIIVMFGYLVFRAFQGDITDPTELWSLGVKLGSVLIVLAVIVAILAGIKAVT